jgi:hypothetical protein
MFDKIRRLLSGQPRDDPMRVRVAPPEPGATMSFGLTQPDADGCVYVDVSMVETAKSHGWTVAHDRSASRPAETEAEAESEGEPTNGGEAAAEGETPPRRRRAAPQ